MSDPSRGIETSAIQLLKRAVELEQSHRLQEALGCYTEGIGLLISFHKETKDEQKRVRYTKSIEDYMDHAEKLKGRIAKLKEEEEQNTRQISIKEDETGHTYESLFGCCMDENITLVEIDDAYIQQYYQVQNFVRFCELLISKAKNVREIRLLTAPARNDFAKQKDLLDTLAGDLRRYNITLKVTYSESQHDREIRFDNDWVMKSGRGLDIYKKLESNVGIGLCDLSFRRCKQTLVDIRKDKNITKNMVR